MLTNDEGVFLRLNSDSSKRILHPAKILRTDQGLFTASFDDASVAAKPGQDATLYFANSAGDFMQQAVRIDAVMQSEDKPTIGFVVTGEPVSAESRQAFRVSTVCVGLTARVGSEDSCPVLDVSATGLSVIVPTGKASLGSIVPVQMRFEGKPFEGAAVVQSVEPLNADTMRVGLHHAAAGHAGLSLKAGLETVTAAVQRRQLRRRIA